MTAKGKPGSRRFLCVLAALGALACRRTPPPPPAREVLTIAVPYEVATLDPHAKDKLGSVATLSNIYEGLVTTDKDMRIRPCLATNWESPDPSTWVFHLRPSVTFHGGRPMRAADVVYSLHRVLQSTSLEMRTYLLEVADVRELDPMTIQVRTHRPAMVLLNKLASVPVIPEGATEATLDSAAEGTGPYFLAAWDRGRSLLLRRNERYWGSPPSFPEAEFLLQRDPEEARQGLLDGRYRLIQCDSKKAAESIAGLGRFAVLRRKNLYVKYLGYDLYRALTPFCSVRPNPFRNRAVRRAVHLAIDRQRLVAALSNYASPATQPVPRFVFGFNPGILEPSHDPERAKALLRAAGLAGGFEVVLHVRRILGEAATLVKEALARVGIKVAVKPLPDPEFYDLVDRRQATFFLNRFGCASGDASDLLDDLIYSPQRNRHLGVRNFGGYASRRVDRAIERSAAIDTIDERRKALQQIMATVMDELVLIPLYNDEDVYAMDRSVSWEPRSDSQVRAAEIRPGPAGGR